MPELSGGCGDNPIMMLTWPLFFSFTFFVLALFYVIRSIRRDKWALWGLFAKLIFGVFFGVIYQFHYQAGDTLQYFHDAGVLLNLAFQGDAGYFRIFFDTAHVDEIAGKIAYLEQPRALFFTKIVVLFYFLGGGNYWIASAFMGLFSFVFTYLFVDELVKNFSDMEMPAKVSFYLLPGFVFWTSGILKETVAISALLLIITLCLKMLRLWKFNNFFYWLVLPFAAGILWELKYYYAAVAMPILGALFIFQVFQVNRKFPWLIALAVLAAAIGLVSISHYNLGFSRILDVVYENYLLGTENLEEGSIHFPGLDGSLLSFVFNTPLALFSGLFRPVLFEVKNLLQFLASLENTVVLILFFTATWKAWKTFKKFNPFVAGTLFYSFSMAILLAFSSPVFGTLSRYKAGFWPFFVMIVLYLATKKVRPSQT